MIWIFLSEYQQAFADLAAQFRRRLAGTQLPIGCTGYFPKRCFKAAVNWVLWGFTPTPDFGGLGLPRLDAAIIFEKTGVWRYVNFAAFMTIHNMVAWMIGEFAKPRLPKNTCLNY